MDLRLGMLPVRLARLVLPSPSCWHLCGAAGWSQVGGGGCVRRRALILLVVTFAACHWVNSVGLRVPVGSPGCSPLQDTAAAAERSASSLAMALGIIGAVDGPTATAGSKKAK
jgi:hypothetical protein